MTLLPFWKEAMIHVLQIKKEAKYLLVVEVCLRTFTTTVVILSTSQVNINQPDSNKLSFQNALTWFKGLAS